MSEASIGEANIDSFVLDFLNVFINNTNCGDEGFANVDLHTHPSISPTYTVCCSNINF